VRSWINQLDAFLFPREGDGWLSLLRVGLGILTVFYAISLQHDWEYLFARNGHELVGPDVAEALLSTQSPLVPRLGWLTAVGIRIGLSESIVLSIAWWLLVIAGAALVAGVFSRASAVVAWLVHLSAAKSAGFLCYGVDNFMTIGFFYLGQADTRNLAGRNLHHACRHRSRHGNVSVRTRYGRLEPGRFCSEWLRLENLRVAWRKSRAT